jgi:starch-binding outer membrane protein, SusD/RagB family
MKRYRVIPLIILFSLSYTACKKDLLDQDNPSAPTVGIFWQSQEDAIKGLTGAYAGMQRIGGWKRWILWQTDLRSDEGYSKSPWTDMVNYARFQLVDYNLEFHRVTWQDHYITIFRANQVLDNVPNIQMDESLKARILAEAKFIRAFMYYTLWNLWGNVPLVLKTQTTTDRPDFSSEQQVWDQIVLDLKEVKGVLPVTYDDANKGRATKGSATALLAKAYMQKRKWAEAATELKEIIDSGTYDLVPNYAENFKTIGENNKESIWEIQFSGDLKGNTENVEEAGASEGNNRAQFFAPRGVGWSDGQATDFYFKELAKERQDGTPFGPLDPRLDASLIFDHNRPDPNDPTRKRHIDPLNPDTLVWGRGYRERANGPDKLGLEEQWFRKYEDEVPFTENYHSPNNVRVIRYADVLLLYAEALNELGRTPEAYPFITKVRVRSKMRPLEVAYPNMSQQQMREQIWHERVVELGGEEQRFFDLKRYGLLETQEGVNKLAEGDPDFNYFQVGKSDLLPIPLNELDINPKLKQNPGW